MPDKKIITVVTPEGEEVEAEVLIYFELADLGKQYIVYTHHEKDKNGMVTVCASRYVLEDDKAYIEEIETEEEWDRVKNIMREVIKNGGDE
mgnify:FL=1